MVFFLQPAIVVDTVKAAGADKGEPSAAGEPAAAASGAAAAAAAAGGGEAQVLRDRVRKRRCPCCCCYCCCSCCFIEEIAKESLLHIGAPHVKHRGV